MPISEEKNPSKNIARLAHSHPEFPPKQRIAVAFSEARRATGKKFARGGTVPKMLKKKLVGMAPAGEHGPDDGAPQNSFRDYLSSMHRAGKGGRVNYQNRLDRTDWVDGADLYDTDEQGRPDVTKRFARGGKVRR
jgi:hypothetical protein